VVTREKEQIIRKLLKEGKDWDFIRMAAHCSPNTIQKVKEKREQSRARKTKSIRSEALLMYSKGYTPFDVVVKLNISADEAENYKLEYLKVKGMDEIEQLYKASKDSLPLIIKIVQEMRTRRISLDQLTQAVYAVNSLFQLRNELKSLNNEIELVREDYKLRNEELLNLKDELLRTEIELQNREVENQRIQDMKNANYKELSKSVSVLVQQTIGNKYMLLMVALQAVIRALTEYPDHSLVITRLFVRYLSKHPYAQIEFDQSILLELVRGAGIFYDDILQELVEKGIQQIDSSLPASIHGYNQQQN